ncbi:hypothetical protein PM082_002159 [Marasmius tenuissimus]|nr:hypothetical protein PM082_002159 [Marasmius tenuissimus]
MAPGQDPWLVLGKSLAVFAAKASPVPGLLPAAEALANLLTSCESADEIANRHSTSRLCLQCYNLLLAVWKDEVKPPTTQQKAFDDVKKTIESVKNRAAAWNQLPWRRAFIQQKQIQEGIEQCKNEILDCFIRLQLASGAERTQWQTDFSAAVRDDHEELVAFLCEIQKGEVIVEEVTREYGPRSIRGQVEEGVTWEIQEVKKIMQMMQQLLAELSNGSSKKEDQVVGLSQNLYQLQTTTKTLLPDPNLVSGEISGIEPRAVAGTVTVDIYRGRYLHRETVAIKVVRAVEGDGNTMRRFLREVQIWNKIWSIDQGTYILPFYGFSQVDEGRPYLVSPWQKNGTALGYVKKNDAQVDYRKLIRNIAYGIYVLHHLMDPPVVHGDIQAANILINAEGNPLLADFGLSKMVEDMSSVQFTQTNGAANLYRWFAPEIYIGNGAVSLASDVYSFAMTVLELLTHNQPFAQFKHPPEVVLSVANGRNPKRPTDAKVKERGLDDDLWTLMEECWNRTPSARPGIDNILKQLEDLDAPAHYVAPVDLQGNAAGTFTSEEEPDDFAPVDLQENAARDLTSEETLHQIHAFFEDPQKCRKVLETQDDEAQRWLDLLQMVGIETAFGQEFLLNVILMSQLFDYPGIASQSRSTIHKLMLRLSKGSGLCPKCLKINNVEKLGKAPIAAGGFGDVWKGKIADQLVCLKVARVYENSDIQTLAKDYMQEAIVWKQLKHPNLLPFVGIYLLNEGPELLCLISPWMEHGDLMSFLKKGHKDLINGINRMSLASDVASGLAHLHGMKIVHSDLKGANVLVTPGLRACIGDFGLSSIADSHAQKFSTSLKAQSVGTTRWQAPELLIPKDSYVSTSESDMYAFGCVCLEIFTGRVPFYGFIDGAVMMAVFNEQHPSRPAELKSEQCDEIWELITSCWAFDPSLRPTAADALDRICQMSEVPEATDTPTDSAWDSLDLEAIRSSVGHPSLDLEMLAQF